MAVRKTKPKTNDDIMYRIGPKAYSPKAGKNAKTWERIQRAAGKDKTIAESKLRDVLTYKDGDEEIRHTDFLGYLMRNDHIEVVKQ